MSRAPLHQKLTTSTYRNNSTLEEKADKRGIISALFT